MKQSRRTWVVVGVLGSLGFLPQCSSDEREFSPTLGDAGTAGDAGETADGSGNRSSAGSSGGSSTPAGGQGTGGDGGVGGTDTPPMQACTIDADCEPDPCNPRTCDDGFCVDHMACANPDAAHCSVVCTVDAGKPTCTVSGADVDKDDHRDELCLDDATADDCNDDDETTHPGADEACDGVDNDCDGQGELEQGLAQLAGTKEAIASGSRVNVAWSAASKKFVVAHPLNEGLEYLEWDAQGALIADSKKSLSAKFALEPLMAVGTTSTAVLYSEKEPDANDMQKSHLFLQRLDAEGELIGARLPLTGYKGDSETPFDIVPLVKGGWAIGYERFVAGSNTRSLVRRLAANGEPAGGELDLGNPQVAAATYGTLSAWGESLAATWITGFGADAHNSWSPRGNDLTGEAFPILDQAGEDRGVAQPTEGGYAFAWYGKTTKAGEIALKFAQRDKAGTVTCGPINLYAFTAVTPPALPTIVPYAGGYFVLAGVDVQTGASLYAAKLRLFVINEGCGDTLLSFPLSPNLTAAGFRPRVAVGDERMIITWADINNKGERLVTGRNLCLPP